MGLLTLPNSSTHPNLPCLMSFHIIETGKQDCLSFFYCIPANTVFVSLHSRKTHILADSFPDILAQSCSEIASGMFLQEHYGNCSYKIQTSKSRKSSRKLFSFLTNEPRGGNKLCQGRQFNCLPWQNWLLPSMNF